MIRVADEAALRRFLAPHTSTCTSAPGDDVIEWRDATGWLLAKVRYTCCQPARFYINQAITGDDNGNGD